MMNIGTGPSVKRVSSDVELSTICVQATQSPMKIRAPMMFAVMNVMATGTPIAMKNITMPIKIASAQYHSISMGYTPSRSSTDWLYMSSIPIR
jgi:hypothetical protein